MSFLKTSDKLRAKKTSSSIRKRKAVVPRKISSVVSRWNLAAKT